MPHSYDPWSHSVDVEFAHRSATYLAQRGLGSSQIAEALVTELELAPKRAEHIVSELAA